MSDRIMDEVYATRQRISSSYGHNVGRYLDGLKEIRERAMAAGMTFAEYCLKFPLAQADSCASHGC